MKKSAGYELCGSNGQHFDRFCQRNGLALGRKHFAFHTILMRGCATVRSNRMFASDGWRAQAERACVPSVVCRTAP
jgi:hypothetical protein